MVSIILVNYNGYDETCELVESLEKYETYPYEVIVVDNASRNNDGERLKQKYPHLNVVCSKDNVGFARGNNLGIEVAKGDYLFILNNDTLIDRPTLGPLVERLESDAKIGCVCPKLTFYPDEGLIQYAGATEMSKITLRNDFIGYKQRDIGQYEEARQTAFAHGAGMMIRRKDVDIYGPMPDCYFLYYEELDWCVQMKNKGFTIWYEPRSVVHHKESASVGVESPLRVYYLMRNRYIFAHRTINKRGERFLSYVYQSFCALPKRFFSYLASKKFNLIKPMIKGSMNGIKILLLRQV